jgi:hypothetical protein
MSGVVSNTARIFVSGCFFIHHIMFHNFIQQVRSNTPSNGWYILCSEIQCLVHTNQVSEYTGEHLVISIHTLFIS